MALSKASGVEGEKAVVKLVDCPNCGKKLMLLPPNYPMYDVQCKACSFRAQVKTNHCKPKPEIYGAGWDILNHVLKAGFMIPHLIVNFVWTEEDGHKHRCIRFYPFIPKDHIRKTSLERKGKKPYPMFNYIGIDKLPFIQLHAKCGACDLRRSCEKNKA